MLAVALPWVEERRTIPVPCTPSDPEHYVISSSHIAIIGSGYVGLTTGVCLSSLGHEVTCVDTDAATIDMLRRGHTALAEPGLDALLRDGLDAHTLDFDTTADAAVSTSDNVFLCLPTPSGPDGAADLTAIKQTIATIRDLLRPSAVLIVKSTVPVGTTAAIRAWLCRPDVDIVSNPEFLREGHAIYDFLHPARILIGADDPAAAKKVTALYDPVRTEVIITSAATAELAKYAANSFLATKLSYVNTVAEMCEKLGADITDLIRVLGTDPRIGAEFLRPGPGWGGPCLPKDTRALLQQARHAGVDFPILAAAIASNTHHHDWVIDSLNRELAGRIAGTRIGVLGLTFKAGTNDLRDSPAIHIARALADRGAVILTHDPTVFHDIAGIATTTDPYGVAEGANELLILTDWPEYRSLDWRRLAQSMNGDLVLDARSTLVPEQLNAAGLRCISIGRARPEQKFR